MDTPTLNENQSKPAEKKVAELRIAGTGVPTPEEVAISADAAQQEVLRNYRIMQVAKPGGGTKEVIEPITVELLKRMIRDHMDGWPKNIGGSVYGMGAAGLIELKSADDLFTYCSARRVVLDFKRKPESLCSVAAIMAGFRQEPPEFERIGRIPEYPADPKCFYTHAPVTSGDGSALRQFLGFFKPATEKDADFIKALVLTLLWGGRPGARPSFLIQGPEGVGGQGVGKTKLAEAVARIAGKPPLAASINEGVERIKQRILASEPKVVLVDNVKASHISSQDIESLITATTISGHKLYHGEYSVQNNIVWIWTINAAGMSRDLAQRVVPIRIVPATAEESIGWVEKVFGFVETHKDRLWGDINAALEAAPTWNTPCSRWASWELSVLNRATDSPWAGQEIKNAQGEIDGELEEAEDLKEHLWGWLETFRAKVGEFKESGWKNINPETDAVVVPQSMVSEEIRRFVAGSGSWNRQFMKRAKILLGESRIRKVRYRQSGGLSRGVLVFVGGGDPKFVAAFDAQRDFKRILDVSIITQAT